jgi:hypothetical protein
MTDLRPCSGCRRHVALDESVCPFCGDALAATSPYRIVFGRVSRAVVFGAALAGGAACGGKKAKTDTNMQNTQTSTVDAGTTTPDETKVPERAPVPMPYGAPPARRRVV